MRTDSRMMPGTRGPSSRQLGTSTFLYLYKDLPTSTSSTWQLRAASYKQGPQAEASLIGLTAHRHFKRVVALSTIYTSKRHHPCVQSLVDSQEMLLNSGFLERVSVRPEIRYLL